MRAPAPAFTASREPSAPRAPHSADVSITTCIALLRHHSVQVQHILVYLFRTREGWYQYTTYPVNPCTSRCGYTPPIGERLIAAAQRVPGQSPRCSSRGILLSRRAAHRRGSKGCIAIAHAQGRPHSGFALRLAYILAYIFRFASHYSPHLAPKSTTLLRSCGTRALAVDSDLHSTHIYLSILTASSPSGYRRQVECVTSIAALY